MKKYKRKLTPQKIEELQKICRFKPTLDQAAAFLEVQERTITKHIEKHYGKISWSEFREKFFVKTRFALAQTIIAKGLEDKDLGALVWATKNLCGWADKQEANVNQQISGPVFVDEE